MTTATSNPEITRDNIERYKTNSQEMGHKLAILSWDESDILDAEVKARKEYGDEGRSDEEIRQEIYDDSDFWCLMHEDLHEQLTQLMHERNPDNKWTARVSNFGWLKRSGTMPEFYCDEGQKLLQKILPDCDCTYYIHNYEEGGIKGFAIQTYFHDSPIGDCWFYVFPA